MIYSNNYQNNKITKYQKVKFMFKNFRLAKQIHHFDLVFSSKNAKSHILLPVSSRIC